MPYHLDLVSELGLRSGDRVALPEAGPDVLPFARAVGPDGHLYVHERHHALRDACEASLKRAGLESRATFSDGGELGSEFDAVVCAFGLRYVPDGRAALAKWAEGLAPKGKLGLMMWGPSEPDDPQDWLSKAAREIDPSLDFGRDRIDTERGALSFLMESAGLALVRHTVVRHNVTFRTAHEFVRAMRDASEWRGAHAALPEAVASRITARVCELAGGVDVPVVFAPAATIAIAGLPGAEIELPHRPSVRIPAVKV